jgi:hypothetical protein
MITSLDTTTYPRVPVTVQRFDSVTEWYRYSEQGQGRMARQFGSGNQSFLGHNSEREAVAYCEQNIGERHMREAKELVDKIDASFRDRAKDNWQPSPFGAYPVVPDYLAGDPFSMRVKHREEDNTAPIRYYIEAVVSGGTGQRALEQRAAGLAALVMRTVEERPIELYALIALHSRHQGNAGYIAVIPINTRPIDLHSTIAAFATREFCRCMAFSNSEQATGTSSRNCDWLYGHPEQHNKGQREQRFRQALGMEPQDVLMQGGYLTDAHLFNSDPVQWVHNQIESQRGVDGDD